MQTMITSEIYPSTKIRRMDIELQYALINTIT